jgi:hypothetical protein
MDFSIFVEPGFIIEFIVVIGIIIWQITSYLSNKDQMDEYMNIFTKSSSWNVERDEMNRVSCITGGASNRFFRDIKDTINKYIAGNSNSVMDFQIFKDVVERQCDSIEDEIESQTPVPLYLGLAGSMIGIIVGLIFLILSGAFANLVAGNENSFEGISSLLLAVAVAMTASLCGIGMTTATAYIYKEKKSKAQKSKNEFMSWMQSVLFPALPNDISFAMTQMVSDLEDFNDKFEKNTSDLSHTFDNVNEAYKNQADIVKAVKDMDIQRMATANIQVLDSLQKSTEKLERFNEYLDHIDGYTSTIQKFNQQFMQEESQLGLLKEIRDFFKTELTEIETRKSQISDAVSEVDIRLRESFRQLEANTSEQSERFKEQLIDEQSQYKEILKLQQDSFANAYDQIHTKLLAKLDEVPTSLDKLKELSNIPQELRLLSESISHSMEQMASRVNQSVSNVASSSLTHQGQVPIIVKSPISKKIMIIGFIMLGLMTIASVGSAIFCAITALGSL